MGSVYAIAAISENWILGDDGKIPWHLPLDFKWFRHKTMGGNLIMGRKTYESIGRPLPGRKTYVLSHQKITLPGVEVIDFSAVAEIEEGVTDCWICGGSEIYNQLLLNADYLYLTRVHQVVSGTNQTKQFYTGRKEEWKKIFVQDQIIFQSADFDVERWKNNGAVSLPEEPWPFGEAKV